MKWFLKILSGSVLAQLLSLIFYPIITRYYSPLDFEKLGQFTMMVGIFSVFVGLKTEQMLTIAPHSENKKWMQISYNTIVISVLALLVILIPISFVKRDYIILLAGIVSAFAVMYIMLTHVNVRMGEVDNINKSRIVQSIASNSAILLGGALNAGFGMLVLGSIINQVAGANILYRKLGLKIDKMRFIDIKETWRELRGQAVNIFFFLHNALVNMILPYTFFILMSFSGNSKEAGFVILGGQILGIPQAIIRRSVAQYIVFRQGKDIRMVFSRIFLYSIILFLVLCILIFFFLGDVSILLGREWSGIEDILKVMIIILGVDYFFYITFQYYAILDSEKKLGKYIDFARFFGFLISMVFFKVLHDPWGALGCFLVCQLITYMAFVYLISRFGKNK